MNYGLTNRVLVRKGRPRATQSGAPRELLNVSLRQSYYTDENASQFDNSYSYGYSYRRAERVLADLADGQGHADAAAAGVDYRARVRPGAGQRHLAEAARHEPQRHAARRRWPTCSARLDAGRPTPAWTGPFRPTTTSSRRRTCASPAASTAAPSRSTTTSRVRRCSTSATSAFYNAQCCGVSFEYQAFNYPANDGHFFVPKDRRFNMSFTLAGVGSFSNFFGAFGGGSY